ncbi:hypothetical protein HDU99_003891, partial [Rhizoclosmatium hyalinum]
FKFHSKWLRNHALFGSARYERRRKEHRRHKSWAKRTLKAVEKELKLAQLVELLSGYERLIQEIRVAELLARYENLVTPLYSLLVFCGSMIGGFLDLVKYVCYSWLRVPSTSLSVDDKFYLSVIVPNGSIVMVLVTPLYSLLDFCGSMIGGFLDLVKYVCYSWLRVPSTSLSVDDKFYLSVIVPNGSIVMVLVTPLYSLLDFCGSMIGGFLDLVKYVYYSWLRVPSTSLSVDDKFYLSVIVPNGSIVMVLVSNYSTVLEAKQAASVGLPVDGLQLYRPGRHWKRLTSGATLSGLGLNPSTLVRLASRPSPHSGSNTTKTSTPIPTSNHLDSVVASPVMVETTVFRNPRLSQTATKSDRTKWTAKNVVRQHTGIWFSDMNPQVSPSWSIAVDIHQAVGVAVTSNSLPVGQSTHLPLDYPAASPTLPKTPKPTIHHPPFPPITLLDFIPSHVVAHL